jgi:hypothetical protein
MNLKIASALLTVFFAVGCATTQSITDAQRKSIRSVTVASDVAIPPNPQVIGPSVNKAGFWFGPIGMLATMDSNDDSARLKTFMYEQGIDIKQIVRQEFVTGLTGSQTFPAILAEGGEATFDLAVENYGFASGFSMRPINKPVRPTLRLAAKLSTSDGKILWQNAAYLTGLNEHFQSIQLEDYYGGGRIQEAFTKAAQILVQELLNDLNGKTQ